MESYPSTDVLRYIRFKRTVSIMQSLKDALKGLEHLKALVTRYDPIKYSSTGEARQLHEEIPIAYGAIEDVYRHFAKDQSVEVADGAHRKTFPNYFTAGYLSGRTFHETAGRNELLKVIGRVRAEIAKEESSPTQSPGVADEKALWALLHPRVANVAHARFATEHYADAVEAALKALNVEVRNLAVARGCPSLDGPALMHTVFSPKNPIIVLADLSTQSGRDMQQGYMELFAGAMSAIRNPKAHDNIVITRERGFHLLFVASTLWHTLDARP
jgi:uncharacterized protein (TIGR02391 family)